MTSRRASPGAATRRYPSTSGSRRGRRSTGLCGLFRRCRPPRARTLPMADDAGAAAPTRTLDIHGIYRLLPHRPPFLMVDRIKDIDGDNFAIGIKNVTANEPFFAGHFP